MTRLRRSILRIAIAAAMCAPLTMPLIAGDTKDSAQVFLKAADLTDIRSPESPPFELDANVQLWGYNGKPIPASYKLIWVSPSEWREELSFGGYSRIRVGGKEGYWQQRSLDYEPLQIGELSEAIDFAWFLRNQKNPGKLKSRKESGAVLDCAESSDGYRKAEYCFDRSQGVLALEKILGGTKPGTYDFRYSNFQAFGEQRFPGTIHVVSEGAPGADFTVARLVRIEKPTSSEFVPPEGASLWLTCSDEKKPRLLSQAQPVYPVDERREQRSGSVVMYTVIGADGSLQKLTVLATPSQGFADAAVEAVRQWRYEPRRCGDTPTPMETYITVVFTLSGPL